MRFALVYFFLACYLAANTPSVLNPKKSSILITEPAFSNRAGLKDLDLARAYLAANRQVLGWSEGTDLLFRYKQVSLTGIHYHFQQTLDGIPFEKGSVVVSVDKAGSQVYRANAHLFPLDSQKKRANPALAMDAFSAMETAWHKLALHGDFYADPQAELVYRVDSNGIRLAYRVSLPNTDPLGDWSMAIDAIDGSLLEFHNRAVDAKQGNSPLRSEPGQSDSFSAALERRERQKTREAAQKTTGKRVDGQGLVFDPDPMTYLMNANLNDSAEPASFDPAYLTKPLRDITFANGVYSLTGPWANIQALSGSQQNPNTPVSTTMDGNWTFRRGNNGFNDSMTYFHIDQSQRYIQSLGFSGEHGIQYGPIRIDTDGAGGADNSFYSPSGNYLVFGHGCVDDNEDADVILHEYGHALHTSINANWGNAGDEGAMGEGFGDYWAGSYSMSSPHGYQFQLYKMFNWDAIDSCWSGRMLDKTHLQYVNGSSYGAHESMPGTFDDLTDELWSAPLFSALLELYRQGIPRSQVDQIVLEGHFGLGSSNTMSVVAESIIQAASRLFPQGPHAQVFRKAFAAQNMVQAATNFTYYSSHVPPTRSSTDWQSEIQVHNPGITSATVTATVYESSESGEFQSIFQAALVLSPGETLDFVPPGSAQRWVRFVSNQPLAGTSIFQRRPSEELGTEKAAIPFLGATETATSLVFPHVPADRARFWSGIVLLNPGSDSVDLVFEWIGANGNTLSLSSSPNQLTLAPFQKRVSFLAPGPGGAAGLFDDSSSQEKVSWVRVTASGPICGFQLYGYNSSTAKVATAGIIATPNQARHLWPVRVSTNQVDWSGFTLLNPNASAADVSVTVYDRDGLVVGSGSFSIPAKTKRLGLNAGGNFLFPTTGTPLLNLSGGSQIQTAVFESAVPLRVFDISGDNALTEIDGAAVLGTNTRTVFTRPAGQIEIVKLLYSGTVQLNFLVNGLSDDRVLNLEAGQSGFVDVPANAESVTIFGELFTATAIQNNSANGSLALVRGKQLE